MEWAEYALAFAAFFLTHSVPIRPPARPWLVARLGHAGFALGYSALSLGVLAWLIGAAGRAPYLPLWPWAAWQTHVVLAVMLPVCLILALSIARPNPFSFGGAWNDRFDASRPGIVGWMRHPLLVALALWAGAHIVPNGDLAHVILFGVLGGFAVAGRALIDRRKRRVLGTQRWAALNEARKAAPMVQAPTSWIGFAIRVLIGVAVFAALAWAHPYVIGVPAL